MTTIHFPDRYQLWLSHDLAKFCPDFYKALRPEDQLPVWQFIEQHYLLKYQSLFCIEFDWGSSGLWKIPFPGSVSKPCCYGPQALNLPDALANQLQAWHDHIDANFEPWAKSNQFDWNASNHDGLEIAKRIKAHIGPCIYLEFNAFRELVIQGDEVIELPTPDFLATITKIAPRHD